MRDIFAYWDHRNSLVVGEGTFWVRDPFPVGDPNHGICLVFGLVLLEIVLHILNACHRPSQLWARLVKALFSSSSKNLLPILSNV